MVKTILVVKTSGWSLYHDSQCVSLKCREVFVLPSSYLYFHLPDFPSIKLGSLVNDKVVFLSVFHWPVALIPCVFRLSLTSGQLPQVLSPCPHLLCQPQCLKWFSSMSTLTPPHSHSVTHSPASFPAVRVLVLHPAKSSKSFCLVIFSHLMLLSPAQVKFFSKVLQLYYRTHQGKP